MAVSYYSDLTELCETRLRLNRTVDAQIGTFQPAWSSSELREGQIFGGSGKPCRYSSVHPYQSFLGFDLATARCGRMMSFAQAQRQRKGFGAARYAAFVRRAEVGIDIDVPLLTREHHCPSSPCGLDLQYISIACPLKNILFALHSS